MAVLAADVQIPHVGNPTKISIAVAGADVFYAGALVFAAAAGGAVALAAASLPFLGIVARQFTTVAAGDLIEVYVDGVFRFPTGGAITIADQGDALIMDASGTVSDNPADCVSAVDSTLVATDVLIGQILTVDADGMWIQLKKGTGVANALGWAG